MASQARRGGETRVPLKALLQHLLHSTYTVLWTHAYVVFPDSDYSPSPGPQQLGDSLITSTISCHLGEPPLRICLWHAVVPATSVPETPVYKHRKAALPKYKVRVGPEALLSASAQPQAAMPSPSHDMHRPKSPCNRCFGCYVPPGAHSRHECGSLLLAKSIHQSYE